MSRLAGPASLALALTVTALARPGGRGAAPRCEPPSAEELSAATNRAPPAARPTDESVRGQIARYEADASKARRDKRWDDLAFALAGIAFRYNFLDEPERAFAYASSALELLPRARNPSIPLEVNLAYGETQQRRRQHASALVHYEAALAAIRSPKQIRLRAQLCSNVGAVHLELGILDSAELYLKRALALRHAIGDREGEATTLNNLGRLLQSLGRADSSLRVFDSVLAIRRSFPNPGSEATTLNNIGYAYDLLGMPDSALAVYERALTVLGASRSSSAGLTLLNRGRAKLALGRIAAARHDLDSGLALERLAGDSAAVSWAMHDLGRAYIAGREHERAIALLDSARAMMRALGDRVREGSALYFLGIAHQERGGEGDLRRAIAYYDEASRTRLAVRRTAIADADRVVFAEQDLNLTARWVLALLAAAGPTDTGTIARASLLAAERGRARSLADLLRADASRRDVPALALLDDAGARGDSAIHAALVRPLGATRTAALMYLVTRDAVIAWLALPSGRVRVHCTRVPRATLDSLVTELRNQVLAVGAHPLGASERAATMLEERSSAPPPRPCTPARASATAAAAAGLDSVLATLSALLLPAAWRAELGAAEELAIVPHGPLALVPFAALPTDSAATPLGVRYALRYAPSLALLAAVDDPAIASARQARPSRALIVGDPVMVADPDAIGVFQPLAAAGATANWLAARLGATALTGPRATERAVRDGIPGADLIHFGTHGRAYATESRARSSFIVLAADGTSDGLFTVAEVLAGPRIDADLVVLLACQTGLGDLKGAEGTVGLQRAFLARGARAVLVSLWEVNEHASDALIRRFYEHWLDPARPVSRAQALRLAQRDVRDSLSREDPNPYYWAGFQLAGAR